MPKEALPSKHSLCARDIDIMILQDNEALEWDEDEEDAVESEIYDG